jgi:hypothetical protein
MDLEYPYLLPQSLFLKHRQALIKVKVTSPELIPALSNYQLIAQASMTFKDYLLSSVLRAILNKTTYSIDRIIFVGKIPQA